MSLLDPAGHVQAAAAAGPRRLAVRYGDRALDYAALAAAVDRAAASLAVERGELVRIGVEPTPDGIAVLLALHQVGAVPLVVPGVLDPQPVGEAPDAAIVVPTSGSTGAPRLVPLSAGNIDAAVSAAAERIGTGPDDTWLLCLPLHHVGGLSVLWRTFAAGGTLRLIDRFDAGDVDAALRGEVTVASLVPTMLRRVLARGGRRYRGLRAVLCGGGPVPSHLVTAGVAAGLPVLATYGMTEATSQVATVAPGEIEESIGTVGRPLDGVAVAIDGTGAITVDGPTVFSGYLGGPTRHAPHRSGDLGHFDDEGRLVVDGRGDDVIVTGGEKVHPAAVEAVLQSHPAVAAAVVFGVPSAEWGMEVIAVVEAEAGGEELRAWVGELLAGHQVPKAIAVTDALPLLSSGKPDRAAIAAAWEGDQSRAADQ